MDQYLLLALKCVRMVAYGLTTMVLVPFLLKLGRTESEIGLFMTLTLVGDVVLSAWITRVADGIGRRFMLGASSILMLLSGVCFMFCTNYTILLVAAVAGVVSPSGDEVGPFRAIEESSVAQISTHTSRSKLFAAQNLVGTLGLAVGALSGGYLVDLFTDKTGKAMDAYRVVFFGYTMCALLSFVICSGLSAAVELPSSRQLLEAEAEQAAQGDVASNASGSTVTPSTAATVSTRANSNDASNSNNVSTHAVSGWQLYYLLVLFGIDSLAYGFMPNSWLVEYLMRSFHAKSTLLGMLFFISTFISALTSFPSAYFTDVVGSVAAICITKLGAGLFGGLVPVANSLGGAMVFVWLRSLFDTMDVVPRQMFLTTIIPEEDRTRVLGLINIVKTFARAAGPIFTGILASRSQLGVCFVIMGCLEWVFSLAVYRAYRGTEELGPIQI